MNFIAIAGLSGKRTSGLPGHDVPSREHQQELTIMSLKD